MRTLTGDHNDRVTDMTALILEPIVLESNQNHATITQTGVCPTLPASMGMGGGYTPMITEPITYAIDHVVCGGGNCTAQGPCYYEEISPTLKAGGIHGVAYTVDMGGGKSSVCTYEDKSPTLTCTHYGEPAVAYGVTTKGNGDAFIARERHTSLTDGGGQAGQGYPCVLYPQD